MYTLLVLGLIPGTNLQITFTAWLIMAALLVAAWVYKRRTGYKFPVQKYAALFSIELLLLYSRVQYRPVL